MAKKNTSVQVFVFPKEKLDMIIKQCYNRGYLDGFEEGRESLGKKTWEFSAEFIKDFKERDWRHESMEM